MELEEIKKLANLARIDMSDEELVGIAQDFEPILTYVGQVQEAVKLIESESQTLDVEKPRRPTSGEIRNVMREDIATENPGEYADRIIEEMPDSEDRYLKVKQIL